MSQARIFELLQRHIGKNRGINLEIKNIIPTVSDKVLALASPHRRDQAYSRGYILRKVTNYAWPRPLKIYVEHGVESLEIDRYEEKINPTAFIVYNEEKAKSLQRLGKNAFCVRDPFTYTVNPYFLKYPFYVAANEIEVIPNSFLYFYGHSTPEISDANSSDYYTDFLIELAKDYDVFTVCLHFHDVQKGIGKLLSVKGLNWTYIRKHPRAVFSNAFYKMVLSYSAFGSNLPGAYLYYLANLRRQFTLYDLKPAFVNVSDHNHPDGANITLDKSRYNEAYEIFSESSAYTIQDKFEYSKLFLGGCDASPIQDEIRLLRKLMRT